MMSPEPSGSWRPGRAPICWDLGLPAACAACTGAAPTPPFWAFSSVAWFLSCWGLMWAWLAQPHEIMSIGEVINTNDGSHNQKRVPCSQQPFSITTGPVTQALAKHVSADEGKIYLEEKRGCNFFFFCPTHLNASCRLALLKANKTRNQCWLDQLPF